VSQHTDARIARLARKAMTLAGALLIAALPMSPVTAHAAGPPPPGSCYGDWCSGRDPMVEHCADDARPLAYGLNAELRWSPRCKTEWVRVRPIFGSPDWNNLGVVQPATGYQQGYSSRNDTYAWSKMIYSPTLCVYGWWHQSFSDSTPCV
jgi:Protein of unknown function (DUF2690)